MALTYEPIATTRTNNNTTSTITFSSIPSTYTHLRIIGSFGSTGSGTQLGVKFNNATGAGTYSNTCFTQDASSGSTLRSLWETSTSSFAYFIVGNTLYDMPTSYYGLLILDIPYYKETNNIKTGLFQYFNNRDSTGSGYIANGSVRFNSSSAVNRLDFIASGGTTYFLDNTRFTLFGITKA